MMTFSTRTKEAVKTGLAMAIAYGSALRERFNRALIKIMDSDDYPQFKKRYIGPGE